ncbi:MAG TPA: XRE family transcriptional regulator [Opitutaceae bacterium]|nr:XRE family transcriptional regulator [Opitutaceae bacterium]
MNTNDNLRRLVGERIRMAREAKGWTQEALAEAMGIADRQTISTIESGERRVAADEMVRFIAVLEQPLAYFTDPHLVVEENVFSYRARRSVADIAEFERQARKLIETNRRLRAVLGETPPPTFTGVRGLTKTSPLETAGMVGYRFFVNWQLGDPPAHTLRQAICEQHHVLVLEVDAPEGVSGAACHLDDGDIILLNRREPSYRKNYTLGHEFFHLLTWQQMPPEKADLEDLERKPKVEQLADAFTANLLVPSTVLKRVWDAAQGSLRDRVLEVARHFDVSGQTAYWRLVNCRYLRDPNRALLNEDLSRSEERSATPPLFARDFVRRVHRAIADGRMTVNAATDLLEIRRDELERLFSDQGLNNPMST